MLVWTSSKSAFLAPIVLCTTPTLLNSCSVVKVTAGIINALLCFPNYTLLDKTVYPATRCSAVLLCPWHTRHLPSSISSWAAFQYLVSTICSKIDKCFPWVKILNQPEVTFLLFFSKEFILLLFRLIRFDSHPFCTLLKRCFHSSVSTPVQSCHHLVVSRYPRI